MTSGCPFPPQIWNCNATTGVVGVFNLQGASWDRSRRRFHIHSATLPELSSEWATLPASYGPSHKSSGTQMATPESASLLHLSLRCLLFRARRAGQMLTGSRFVALPRSPCSAAVVRPTDVELFRQQLESMGCDVAGALAAAAEPTNGSRPGRRSASPSGAAATSKQQQGSAAVPRSSSGGLSAGSASSPAPPSWVPAGASFMSAGGAASRQRGRAEGTEEDEEAAPRPAVPDFAVYVGATDELHRVSWDKGVPVHLQGEAARAWREHAGRASAGAQRVQRSAAGVEHNAWTRHCAQPSPGRADTLCMCRVWASVGSPPKPSMYTLQLEPPPPPRRPCRLGGHCGDHGTHRQPRVWRLLLVW